MRFRALLAVGILISFNAAGGDGLSLARKAALFQYDMEQRFLLDGQALCKRHLPTERRPSVFYNMPDNAYMTGIYLGTLAMKYAVTHDDADKAAAFASIDALHRLCTVSGKKGVPARAMWPKDKPYDGGAYWHDSPNGQYRWWGDVSSDQIDGIMFGYFLAHELVADDAHRRVIAEDVADVVSHILDNGLQIVDVDGTTTRFGDYSARAVKTVEPMNALVLLQHLKIAAHITGNERFTREYHRIAIDERYGDYAVRARWMFIRVNYSDDVMLALAYYPLFVLEDDPAFRDIYLKSFQRSWHGEGSVLGMKAQRNPVYALLAQLALDDDSAVADSLNNLRMFALDMKWNRGTIAEYEKTFGFTFDPTPSSADPQPNEALPLDRRQRTWSAWVQNPFEPAVDRRMDEPIEYNGHDYLLAYWFARYLKRLGPDE